jgi:hypothetical protein
MWIHYPDLVLRLFDPSRPFQNKEIPMHTRHLKSLWITGVALTLLLMSASVSFAGPQPATYEVTITNLTTGQPFTPPLLATHRQPISVFEVGSPASLGVQEIAENGNLAPLNQAVSNHKHVSAVMIAGGGPLLAGQSVTAQITGNQGAKLLSFVTMLVCTNDGFTGVDSVRLPKQVGDQITLMTNGYDAGTEINTEDFADLVPPCPALTGVPSSKPGTGVSNPALAEGGVIVHHMGIEGTVDLNPSIHGWTDPVAAVEITRIN